MIRIDHVTFSYGEENESAGGVQDINLNIEDGQFIVLCGESGCGMGASALCFVTWNFAVKLLGAVRTSVYIYIAPVVTVVTSFLVLHEPITYMTGIGTVLTLTGLLLSESKSKKG